MAASGEIAKVRPTDTGRLHRKQLPGPGWLLDLLDDDAAALGSHCLHAISLITDPAPAKTI
jgi:hypothetical protein